MGKEDLKSKPENIREKMVEGRMAKLAKEMALLEQPFVKDTTKSVGELVKEAIAATGENIKVTTLFLTTNPMLWIHNCVIHVVRGHVQRGTPQPQPGRRALSQCTPPCNAGCGGA